MRASPAQSASNAQQKNLYLRLLLPNTALLQQQQQKKRPKKVHSLLTC